ncbi:MAG: hypothetical protein ACF8XB_18135, partial [Planctomycetota bacterium JB042]
AAGRVLLRDGAPEGADVMRGYLDHPRLFFTAAELLLRADRSRYEDDVRAAIDRLDPAQRREALELLRRDLPP